uniref:Uncharacterized protein n=1 Tax=Panagrolaimus superbus TaxID=310955 RepID=A0A914Y9Q8_9BILA
MSNLARGGFPFNFPMFQGGGGAVAIANGPGAVAVANARGSLSYAEAIAVGENARAFANANSGDSHMTGNIVESNGGFYYWNIFQPFSFLYNFMRGHNTPAAPPSNALQQHEEH